MLDVGGPPSEESPSREAGIELPRKTKEEPRGPSPGSKRLPAHADGHAFIIIIVVVVVIIVVGGG